ncbi:MAG: RHS repeat-associated core domain-containing protein [Pyrinomonadaceae bacterium]|nr:RHS repeat-associated core domain-containing protein [Pyrinomonadaceae bacterium]
MRQKFTSYERDQETNLDFAQARYDSNLQGRFTSPDPLMLSADPWQPQSMNRYSYVINNPLNLMDPSGLYFVGGGTAETNQDPADSKKKKEPKIEPGSIIDLKLDGANFVKVTVLSIGSTPTNVIIFGPGSNGTGGGDGGGQSPQSGPFFQARAGDQTKPLQILAEFVSGLGERSRQFGPDSTNTQGMQASPEVGYQRYQFCDGGACYKPLFGYHPEIRQFGPLGWGLIDFPSADGQVRSAGAHDPARSITGSFDITIKETNASSHRTLFILENDMSRESALYHIKTGNLRSGPLATTHQTYWWIEINPCGCK